MKLGRKLEFRPYKVTEISDEMLAHVGGGHKPCDQDTQCTGPHDTGTIYPCDTNATCIGTGCISCGTVCTCGGGC